MNGILPMIIFIVLAIVSILLVSGVIYLIISAAKNKDEKKKFKITTSLLLNIYLYGISFIALILSVIGGAIAIKSGLSYMVGIPFGYNLDLANSQTGMTEPFVKDSYEIQECYVGSPIYFNNNKYCFDSKQREKDLVNGITLFASMGLIFALHQYGIKNLKKKYDSIEKIYTFSSLVVYSLLGLITIPMAIYQSMNYFLFKTDITNLEAPAIAIGLAVLTIPLWIIFLKRTLREKDPE